MRQRIYRFPHVINCFIGAKKIVSVFLLASIEKKEQNKSLNQILTIKNKTPIFNCTAQRMLSNHFNSLFFLLRTTLTLILWYNVVSLKQNSISVEEAKKSQQRREREREIIRPKTHKITTFYDSQLQMNTCAQFNTRPSVDAEQLFVVCCCYCKPFSWFLFVIKQKRNNIFSLSKCQCAMGNLRNAKKKNRE